MRLFVAIDFNSINGHLRELQMQLLETQSLSLASSFHLTLKFLGEVREENCTIIRTSLRQIKFEEFGLTLEKVGVFEAKGTPRVVFAGVKSEKKLLELQQSIHAALKSFKRDFDFKAHITLARVKKLEHKKKFLEGIAAIKPKNLSVNICKFELMESKITTKGPVYIVIETFSCSHQ